MSESQEKFDEYAAAFLAPAKALVAELDRDYSDLCEKIRLYEESIGPAEWATMVGAKAQLIVARTQVLVDVRGRFRRDPVAKALVWKIDNEKRAERK